VRYRLRTLLILMAVGPPILAGAWLYTVPIVTSLAFLVLVTILAACLFGAVIGRTMLWAIEALVVLGAWLLSAFRRMTRRKSTVPQDDAAESSLTRLATSVRARRQATASTRLDSA
jgi:thiol:disulfide interchange protein